MLSPKQTFDWTSDAVADLKKYVSEGFSYGQIARLLGCTSRNQPLCKFNRLKKLDATLSSPRSQERRRPVSLAPIAVVARVSAEAKLTAGELVPFELDGTPITLDNRESSMCEYPIGDPLRHDFRYCGHVKHNKSPYCEAHHKLCRFPNVRKPKVDHQGKQRA
jgi:GcrA cell cycle regulator